MRQIAAALLPLARVAVIVMFSLLALVAVLRAPRSGVAGKWVAAAFGSFGLVLLEGTLADAFHFDLPGWIDKGLIVLLLAFPYLLLRFTASFHALPRWLEVAAAVAAAGIALATLVLPPLPEADPRPLWAGAYVTAALAYWVAVSLVTVVRLWHAGYGQATVARRRLRLMSTATAVLAIALLVAGQLGDVSPLAQLSVQGAALASAVAFGLGFSPPRAVRLSWRRPEEEHLQRGMMAVLRAATMEEVADELLPPTVRVVGGGGAALVDAGGHVVATSGQAPPIGTDLARSVGDADVPGRQVVALGEGRGELMVWTSPYTPFFGREEVDLLRTMAAVASLALERCELLAVERARRAAVEQAQHEAERAREEATRANTAKNDFLSRMSHELRTPLNAILGFGQLLEISALDADGQEGVEHILKAGRHLLALINDVLDLSRIETGTLTVSLEPVEATELIHDTLALIQPLADNRSIRLSFDPDGCELYVMTDRQRCRQILLNLLSNGVKYNHDGGAVDVRCARVTKQNLRISVRDTGPGIDPARQERLFEPFDRLGAESSGVEGTGLGLALTKQLVERLGGTIGVHTAPGQGSTFWIDLPLADSPTATDEPHASPDTRPETRPETSGHYRSLLLVEDNLANLRLVEAMLRQRPGITVLPAMQGGLAIELAQEHRPDVIILDLHLPDLSGREVMHRLRADPRTREIPIVIASADATPGRIQQLQQEGAFDYLTKPLDLQQFLDVVDAALGHHTSTT